MQQATITWGDSVLAGATMIAQTSLPWPILVTIAVAAFSSGYKFGIGFIIVFIASIIGGIGLGLAREAVPYMDILVPIGLIGLGLALVVKFKKAPFFFSMLIFAAGTALGYQSAPLVLSKEPALLGGFLLGVIVTFTLVAMIAHTALRAPHTVFQTRTIQTIGLLAAGTGLISFFLF